jgi:drug/metabolite transporter (DMT)-like permease
MKNKLFLSNLMLLIAAFIWGTAFVAQIMGMAYIGPFTFAAVRYVMGASAIFVFTCAVDIFRKTTDGYTNTKLKIHARNGKIPFLAALFAGACFSLHRHCNR